MTMAAAPADKFEDEIEELVEDDEEEEYGVTRRNRRKVQGKKRRRKNPNKTVTHRRMGLSCAALATLAIASVFGALTVFWDNVHYSSVVSKSSSSSYITNITAISSTSTTQPEWLAHSALDHESIVEIQIARFRRGTGLLLNFHIYHHAGTTMCALFSNVAPSFVCSGPTPDDHVSDNYPRDKPWSHNDTATNIHIIRQFFQYTSWQFTEPPGFHETQIKDTNWEDPDLVSILIMREPISRSLAGDSYITTKYPSIFTHHNATEQEWWQFAHEPTHNNNYALRILSDATCCNGSHTSHDYVEAAQALVRRFTFVVDLQCLREGLEFIVVEQLGMDTNKFQWNFVHDTQPEPSLEELIPYPAVLDYLREKNKMDIELYEWSKTFSVVNCQELLLQEQAKHDESGSTVP
ncbi:expressed unknown protein [Seminavis robusta]|uniref:Uncharacterized protein n=1 Tax=Seminavis robusta TaxID=568900 RepID=A0A9N8DP13_9STRA|nr:expressed unknown protein [Seminavis robusta]|eukprot:Sro161_g072630.1 n/a (407) ;mRNA; f:80728-82041